MRADNPPRSAPFVGLLALCALCAALLLTFLFAPPAQAAACSNEAIRAEQGAAALALPDCRAYELVSPGSIPSLSKFSTLGFGGGKASPEGNAISYFSRYPAEGSQTSSETWLSRRTGGGWALRSLDPQMTPAPTENAICQPGVSLSEDLEAFLLSAGGDLESIEVGASGECGFPAEELVPGEPRGYSNLYLRRGSDPYALANPAPIGVTPANATFQAASSDLSRVVFNEAAELTPESVPGSNLFMWSDGVVRAIGILPNGEHVPAKLGAAGREWGGGDFNGPLLGLAPVTHSVSADGERVFFEANGNLYLRENAGQAPAADANCGTTSEIDLACTLQLDRSLGAGLDGGGVFQFASRAGDRVFFTSDHALTFPASAQAGKPDLYEYDVSAGKLTNLTAAGQSEAANVRGISGGSDDGSHVYFVARGVLTGSEQNGQGEAALPAQPNLYLARNGGLTYVATLSTWQAVPAGGVDQHNWWETAQKGAEFGVLKTAWSPSGSYLLFSSHKSLTGFDNTPAEPGLCEGGPCEQLFLYDAEGEDLSCVSCDPGGDRPVASTRLVERAEFLRFAYGPRYAPRSVLDSGQVFFETENRLSDQDVNGFQDVYEYRAGTHSLISSGTAVGGSAFVDASVDGRDVFFATPEALVRSDRDGGLPSIYDARAGGGFAEPPPPPPPCAGEGCRPPGPPPPAGSLPLTTTFAGPGNVRPRPRKCKRGKVRRGGRCVKKKAKRQNKQRSGQRRAERNN
jgi:hypothetical protein